MTLIEFTIAAKKIVDDAGLGPCTVTCASDMRIGADGKIEYQHKVTAHPASGMLTSWQEPSSYSCNNPTLALERFQIAVDRRLAPPSEPEAITEIEAPEEVVGIFVTQEQLYGMKTVVSKNAPQPESEVDNA